MNKDAWPLPRSLQGWGIFVALLMLYGSVYYAIGFPLLWRAYHDMGKSVSLTCKDDQNHGEYLRGTIHYPRVVSDATKQFAFLTIVSKQKQPLEDVTFWVAGEDEQNGNAENDDVIFLPHFVEGSVFQRTVSVQRLQPYERVSFRLEILGVDKGGLRLRWQGQSQGQSQGKKALTLQGKCDAVIEIESNVFPAIIMSLIQEILLPPWANSVIVVVALVGAVMLEDVWKRHRDDGLKKFCLLFEYALALDVVLWGGVMSVTIMMLYWPVGKVQEREWWNWLAVFGGFVMVVLLIAALLWVWESKGIGQIERIIMGPSRWVKKDFYQWYCVVMVMLTVIGIGLIVALRIDISKAWPYSVLLLLIGMMWAIVVLRMWREEMVTKQISQSILRVENVVSYWGHWDIAWKPQRGLTVFSLAEHEGIGNNKGLLLPPFLLLSKMTWRYNKRLDTLQTLLTSDVYIAKENKGR